MWTSICSRISRISNELLKTRQNQDFIKKYLEKGKKQDIQDRENQEYS